MAVYYGVFLRLGTHFVARAEGWEDEGFVFLVVGDPEEGFETLGGEEEEGDFERGRGGYGEVPTF